MSCFVKTKMKKTLKILITIAFVQGFFVVHAETNTTEQYNPVPAIMHHISDSHEWHLFGEGENSISIPLPIIL